MNSMNILPLNFISVHTKKNISTDSAPNQIISKRIGMRTKVRLVMWSPGTTLLLKCIAFVNELFG